MPLKKKCVLQICSRIWFGYILYPFSSLLLFLVQFIFHAFLCVAHVTYWMRDYEPQLLIAIADLENRTLCSGTILTIVTTITIVQSDLKQWIVIKQQIL